MTSVFFARFVLLARGPSRFDGARADRSNNVGSARVRGTLGPLLGCAFLLSCVSVSGCSFHSHSEWHAGKGGEGSSGGESEAQPEGHEHSHHSQHEGRHSPGGRDKVVRVTGSDKSAGEQGGGADGEEPARTAVHPSGDVPPSSSASSGGSSGSGAGSGEGAGGAAREPAASAPAQPAESAPAADAPAEQAPSSGKGTLKSPSEPHVTTPSQRKPRKVHRTGDGQSTNKEGRRE